MRTVLVLCVLWSAGALLGQDSVLVRTGKAWISPERTMTHASLLLAGGKVADLSSRKSANEKSELFGRAQTVLTFETGVATAGFVDIHCHVGARDELAESAESFTPELRAALAYDPYAPGVRRLSRRGVTTVLLAPDDKNLAGGLAAFVKPGRPLVQGNPDAFLKISLTKDALHRERRPTSLLGATDYLREYYDSLATTEPADRTPAQKAIEATVGGARNVGISCSNPREILAAVELVASYRLEGFLIHARDAEKCLDRIKTADLAVVLEPLHFDSTEKALRLPGLLSSRGITFAFAGETARETEGPRLQLSLALAVRRGLEAKQALASVTTAPAGMAGLQERVGTLFQGRDADVLVWSHEPWNPRARLLAVIQDGHLVYDTRKSTK